MMSERNSRSSEDRARELRGLPPIPLPRRENLFRKRDITVGAGGDVDRSGTGSGEEAYDDMVGAAAAAGVTVAAKAIGTCEELADADSAARGETGARLLAVEDRMLFWLGGRESAFTSSTTGLRGLSTEDGRLSVAAPSVLVD